MKKESPLTYALVPLIACAGLFYINITPGITSALINGAGLDVSQAGYVMSANGTGGMLGAVAALFLLGRIHWKTLCLVLLGFAFTIEMTTPMIPSFELMAGWRFSAGLAGGCAVAISFSLMGRLQKPDRAFGMLVFQQFGLGGVVMTLRPELEALGGDFTLFYATALLIAITIGSVLFLPSFDRTETAEPDHAPTHAKSRVPTICLLLLGCVFLFQAGAFGIWTYIERIALADGMEQNTVSRIIGWTIYLGLIGALIPMTIGNRFGRLAMVVIGVCGMIFSFATLFWAANVALFLVANVLLNVFWAATIAYLLAAAASSEASGRIAVASTIASKLGIAVGPLIAATALSRNETNFTNVIISSIVLASACLLLSIYSIRRIEASV